MINDAQDIGLGAPQFYFLTDCNNSEFCNFQWRLNNTPGKNVVARMIRGDKCRTVKGLFDEFAAALQFPYYFGENWNAFDECLNDLEWITSDAFVLCVNNSESLLHLENEDFKFLVESLLFATKEWEKGRDDGAHITPPTPFKIVFQCGEEKKEEVIAAFRSAGMDLECDEGERPEEEDTNLIYCFFYNNNIRLSKGELCK